MKFITPSSESENKRLKKELSSHVAGNIKELRLRREMTQQELAEKTDLHLTYVGHLEAGKYHPSTFVLWKISRALGFPLDEFVK